MITIVKTDEIKITEGERKVIGELRGLSTDEKPTKMNGATIDNGSIFIEIDTGNIFMYDLDSETWKEI